MLGAFELFFKLLCGHAIADYALQSKWMVDNKKRPPNLRFDLNANKEWWWVLTAHALINGFFVAMFTCPLLGIAETVIHWISDFLKCEGKISSNVDQAIHIICKGVWCVLYQSYLSS